MPLSRFFCVVIAAVFATAGANSGIALIRLFLTEPESV